MSTARRSVGRATTTAFEQAGLRNELLKLYASDRLFTRDLTKLFVRHRATIGAARAGKLAPLSSSRDQWFTYTSLVIWLQAAAAAGEEVSPYAAQMTEYVADVRGLVQRAGLDHLRDLPGQRPSLGYRAIHDWCQRRSEYRSWKLSNFGWGIGATDWPPAFGEQLSRIEHGEVELGDYSVLIGEEERSPVAHVSVDVPWNPLDSSREEAQRTILGMLEAKLSAELDRIQEEAQRAGLIQRDREPMRARDVWWLWLCFRHGRTYDQIRLAHTPRLRALGVRWRAPQDVSTVRKAVRMIADRAGVSLPAERNRKPTR